MPLRVTYYDIAVEEVLLDDGFVSGNPRLRLDRDHSPIRPQVGERFVFSLARNPGNSSYGVVADWMVLTTANGMKNYDGSAHGYEGAIDETSFLRAVRAADQSYNFKEFRNWPDKPWPLGLEGPSPNTLSRAGDSALQCGFLTKSRWTRKPCSGHQGRSGPAPVRPGGGAAGTGQAGGALLAGFLQRHGSSGLHPLHGVQLPLLKANTQRRRKYMQRGATEPVHDPAVFTNEPPRLPWGRLSQLFPTAASARHYACQRA